MLTKEEIMEVFSGRGCKVEDKAKDENWFFYTREGIHYEVQIDVDKEDPAKKIFVILCPCMGKVDEIHGYLLEQAVNMVNKSLKDGGIDQFQLDYHPEDCTADSCMGIYYRDYSKQDLDRALDSAFKLDDYVNEMISKAIQYWISGEDTASEN